jgi:RHS repeat-associated protein
LRNGSIRQRQRTKRHRPLSTVGDTNSPKKVTYPGTSNYTQWTYDGFGRRVKEVETRSGTVTSTKQSVWAFGVKPLEARDASSNITAQYFVYGETISGANYYYTKDHLGSIREMTNSSGVIEAQYSYDSYGRVIQLQGTAASDFQYAAYYYHSSSALNLTLHRAYNANLARWMNRDLIGEVSRTNLYAYVHNSPISSTDSSGLFDQIILDPHHPNPLCIINPPDMDPAERGMLDPSGSRFLSPEFPPIEFSTGPGEGEFPFPWETNPPSDAPPFNQFYPPIPTYF